MEDELDFDIKFDDAAPVSFHSQNPTLPTHKNPTLQ